MSGCCGRSRPYARSRRPPAAWARSGGGTGRDGTGRAGRLSRFALAACLAAAAGFGGIAVWQHQEAQDARSDARAAQQRSRQVAEVISAPDARSDSATLSDGVKGTVVVSRSQDRAVFLASGLAQAPGGKVYQLWFDDGGTMRSAGLMQATGPSSTTYATLLDGPVDGATGMGITVEPHGRVEAADLHSPGADEAAVGMRWWPAAGCPQRRVPDNLPRAA